MSADGVAKCKSCHGEGVIAGPAACSRCAGSGRVVRGTDGVVATAEIRERLRRGEDLCESASAAE
jgi:DnaJ-class molecular chaperone